MEPRVKDEYFLDEIRLTKDLKKAAKKLTAAQVRYLVDRYYQLQNDRIRAANQVREEAQPNELLGFVFTHAAKLESSVKTAMHVFAKAQPAGQWLLSLYGIGPVLAAGMIAHLDITKASTAGHFWNFAGLNPNQDCKPKTTRPWNARLKVLCWKAGDSFVKFHNRPQCYYGKLYEQRKALEIERNDQGLYAEQAKDILQAKKFKKDTNAFAAYSIGKLPAGHLDARARRVAVKMLLSHLHHVMYEIEYKKPPPVPYIIAIGGHTDYVPPPNWDALAADVA